MGKNNLTWTFGVRVFHTIDVPGINNKGDTHIYIPHISLMRATKYVEFFVGFWLVFLYFSYACGLLMMPQEVREQVLLASNRRAEDIKYAHTLHNLWHMRPNRKNE